MPTPPLSDELAREALQAWIDNGRSQANAALALGLNFNTFRSRLDKARERGLHLSDGAREIVAKAGLSGNESQFGWIPSFDSEGKKIGNTFWKAPTDQQTEDFLARVRTAFEGLTPSPPVKPPKDFAADKCNVLPLFDVHWAMAAWGEETGHEDYNIELARDDMMRGLEAILTDSPRADTCLVILGGDFLHADDDNAQTPSSKHPLDVASRQHRALDSGIAIIKYVVTRVLECHSRVVVRVLRGNHDPNSHKTIAFALREWMAHNPRAKIDMTPQEIFMMQWGRVSIFTQHGDKMKPVDLSLKIADICPFWTESPHRYAYTGHKHSLAAERIGGLNWERLEPFAPSDVYGSSWVNRRAMKIDTYHKQRGRIGSVIDPLERSRG